MTRRSEPEAWFLAHGLPYFVAAERAAARAGLRPRRLVPLLVVLLLVAAAAGGLLGWVSDQYSAVPAIWLSLTVLGLLGYGATALHARADPRLRAVQDARQRAVPAAHGLAGAAAAAGVRDVPVHQRRGVGDDDRPPVRAAVAHGPAHARPGRAVPAGPARQRRSTGSTTRSTTAFVVRACAGHALEQAARDLAADPGRDPAAHAQVTGFERWNLILVLLVIQTVQVLLLSVAVFAFFLLFGSLVMQTDTQLSWTGLEPDELRNAPVVTNVSVSLMKVSLFLRPSRGSTSRSRRSPTTRTAVSSSRWSSRSSSEPSACARSTWPSRDDSRRVCLRTVDRPVWGTRGRAPGGQSASRSCSTRPATCRPPPGRRSRPRRCHRSSRRGS